MVDVISSVLVLRSGSHRLQNRLKELEDESVFIIREAFSKCKSLAVLWSMGKDSTVLLHLVRKAFLGNVPIPVVHIDTSYKMKEMIEWRDNYARKRKSQFDCWSKYGSSREWHESG